MKHRKHNDFNVSEVGVGCYALSGVYGGKDVEEFKRMLNRAYELGVNFFDTADVYGMRKTLDTEAEPKLEIIRDRLRDLIMDNIL